MAGSIHLKGVDSVIQQYEYRETPFFAIYEGKNLLFYNDENDLDAGKILLLNHLELLEKSRSTAAYRIVFFKRLTKDNDLDRNSELGSNTFKLVDRSDATQEYWQERVTGGSNSREIDNKILMALNSLESRLTAIEQPLNDETEQDEDDATPTGKLMGALGSIIQMPQIQEILAAKLVGLLNMIPTTLPAAAPTAVQSNNQKHLPMSLQENELPALNESITVLVSAGMSLADFQKLALMAQTNQGQFQMLLSMLKNTVV